MKLEKNHKYCFGCGTENPEGLGLSFSVEDDFVVADFVPRVEHQSYKGIVHGGIIGSVLDEAMGHILGYNGIQGITAEYTVRLKAVLSPKEVAVVKAKIISKSRKLVRTEATLFLRDSNNVIATATGIFLRADEAVNK